MVWLAVAVLGIALLYPFNRRLSLIVALPLAGTVGLLWILSGQVSERRSDEKLRVTITAEADPGICVDNRMPVAVTVTNGADSAIRRFSFDLFGMARGRSDTAYRGYLRSDQVVLAGEQVTRCYALLSHGFAHPRPVVIDATKYDWTAKITLVDFRAD